MWLTLAIVVGSVLLVVSGFSWAARREMLERARLIAMLEAVPLSAAALRKPVAVKADVSAIRPVADPVVGRDVAFFEATVLRTDGHERAVATVREGDAFELKEANERALVRLEGAELALELRESERSDGEPSARMRAVLERAGVEVPPPEDGARYVVMHRALVVDEPVTVVGIPRRERNDSGRKLFDAAAGLLIVTDQDLHSIQEREATDARAMTRMLRIGAALGVAFVALGVVLFATQR